MNQISPIRVQVPERARDYTGAQLDLIKRTVAADCNNDEFSLFIEVCRRVGLDPFRKQIYALVYNKDKPDKRKMSIITGIDGFRAVAARNRDYRPDDAEPVFETSDALKSTENPLGFVKAVVRAYKLAPDGQWHPAVGVAYWSEFAPIVEDIVGGFDWVETGEKWADSGKPKMKKQPREGAAAQRVPSGNWATMPHVMLAKCAEAQALRKGWPEDLSGIYAPEEMERAIAEAHNASEIVEKHREDVRLQLVNARDTTPLMFALTEGITFVSNGQVVDRVAEHVRSFDNPDALAMWRDQNANGLKQFWATHKADALEIKRLIEGRITEMRKAGSTILQAG